MGTESPSVATGDMRADGRLIDLGRKLALSERRHQALVDVILALDLDLTLEDLLDRVVAVIGGAMGSAAGFVYIWEEQSQRLVLRAATEGDQRPFLGAIRLRLGEGVTGWSAETRQPTLINSCPLDDPRFSVYPELKEERFGGMLTAPILVREDTVVGVFTLYSKESGHFANEHVQTVIEVAKLLAGAIERAHLRDQDARQAKTLALLGELKTRLSSNEPLTHVIDKVIATTLDAIAAELCLIVLFDPSEVRLGMRGGASDDTPAAAREAIKEWALGAAESGAGKSGALPRALEELTLCPPSHLREFVSAPLVAGAEQIGVINCYRSGRYSVEERELLSTIADQIALTIRVRRLKDMVLEHSPSWRLHRLLISGTWNSQVSSLAAALGCDVSQPHAVVKARMLAFGDDTWQDDLAERITRSAANLGRLISSSNPGSIVHHADGQMVALVRLCGQDAVETLRRRLDDARKHLEDRFRVCMSAGLSTVSSEAQGYADVYRQAQEALEIGSSLRGEGHVISFEQLGPYVYLYRITADPIVRRDPMMTRMSVLVDYDRKRGSRLLETLDCYLECRGNASLAARRLIVHRNTLRQRLTRIEQLTGIDLAHIEDWFPLQFATKLMRLRLPTGAVAAGDLRGDGLEG